MLSRIIEWSLKNQFLVIVGMVFAILGGVWSMRTIRLDAIPDLSDVQVIIYTDYPGQAPQVVEDQITYPMSSKMLSVPFAKVVRGYSFFGFSFVYVIFEDGTDLYWARSRVLEYLNGLAGQLPGGVNPQLGPDATGVGWAFMYVLNSPERSLADLRSYQDWYLKYGLMSVEGVSEVASLGGFVRQYQVEVDPVQLRAFDVDLAARCGHAMRTVRTPTSAAGLLETLGARVHGPGQGLRRTSIERPRSRGAALGTRSGVPRSCTCVRRRPRRSSGRRCGAGSRSGTARARRSVGHRPRARRAPTSVSTIATGQGQAVEPSSRRGSAGGHRDLGRPTTARELIDRVDRHPDATRCSRRWIDRLDRLRGLPLPLPIGAGGDRVDSAVDPARFPRDAHGRGWAPTSCRWEGLRSRSVCWSMPPIILVENAHKHYEEWRDERSHFEIILRSAQEVGPTLFFSLLLITISFTPVFTLQAQEGRLFRPLAFTKTYSMAMASVVAITVIPVLMYWFVRGKIHSEEKHPVSRILRAIYTPVLGLVLRWRWLVVALAIIAVASVWFPLQHIGSEFMPPLWEGDLLYMPTTFPGISITKAKELLQQTDKIIATFPEVESVLGKVGRAETATDPAPLSMIETTIVLKDPSEWRPGMTKEKLIEELDRAIQFPGLTNAWTMPIKTRIDMLSTGIKTPVGIKIGGPDLTVLERIATEVEAVVKPLEGTLSAYAERVMGGSYLDFDIDRESAARYGITVGDVQDVIMSAIGGMNVGWTVEGLERYPINIRYPRELRDNIEALAGTLVAAPNGAQVPLSQLATIRIHQGPPAIKSENARPNAWVYVDLRGIDVGTWVERARQEVEEKVDLPSGYTIFWSGQYEYMQRAKARLLLIVPITLLLVFLILYFNTGSLTKTSMVLLAVPFSAVGAIWLMYFLGYNWSIAVWVGLIALAGLDAETGVVMLLYLDIAYERWKREGRLSSWADLAEAVDHGAVKRIRPKAMTVATTFIALLPILWATGTGADVMRRIAAPMVGGIVTSFIGELLVYPAIYFIWRSFGLRHTALSGAKNDNGERDE